MRRFDATLAKTSIAVTLVCLASGSVSAQIGNPWNPSPKVPTATSSQYAAPAPQIVTAQASAVASKYAPADLEQRLSMIKPARSVAQPVVPQMAQPQTPPMQPRIAGQKYQTPAVNGYQNNTYGVPQQGYAGYPPNYGQQGYNSYGNPMPYGPGNYPGGGGRFGPSGGFPGGGSAPFNFSPFGFF